jgi:hypothetical protein
LAEDAEVHDPQGTLQTSYIMHQYISSTSSTSSTFHIRGEQGLLQCQKHGISRVSTIHGMDSRGKTEVHKKQANDENDDDDDDAADDVDDDDDDDDDDE